MFDLDPNAIHIKTSWQETQLCLRGLSLHQHARPTHAAFPRLRSLEPRAVDFHPEMLSSLPGIVWHAAADGKALTSPPHVVDLQVVRRSERLGSDVLPQQLSFFSPPFVATVNKACMACNPNHKTTRTPSTVTKLISQHPDSMISRISEWQIMKTNPQRLFRGKFYS